MGEAGEGWARARLKLDRIHHLGLIVSDLEHSLDSYARLLGSELEVRRRMEEEGMEAALVRIGGERVELIQPLGEGPLKRFLDRRGDGVHHVAWVVDDLDQALGQAAELGQEVVPPGIRLGLGGERVAFLHPRGMGGVLTELVEERP
ncbi:MAG TPA: VOC family protein [Candidatus Nitrosotalea sp.]|nr:VOC family protein [Candidatus Nitrosotalea sp.]